MNIDTSLNKNDKNFIIKGIKDSLTLAHRNILKIKHTPEKLVDVTIQPIFFMIIFTYLFGGAISGDAKNYLPIIIPGMLIQTLLACCSSTGTQLKEDIETGVFDRFKSLPIARIAPLAGPLIADALRYSVATIISLSFGYILGWRPEAGLGFVIVASFITILFSWSISWVFAFFGLVARSVTTVQSVSTITMFTLTFLSNAFVPTDTMPKWLQIFVNINPVTHVVSSFREIVTNGVIGTETYLTLIGAAVVVVIFAPLTLLVYNKK